MKKLFILFLLTACTHRSQNQMELAKRNIVLIQGVHLDEFSWKEVKDRLLVQHFKVITLGRVGRDVQTPSLKDIASQSCLMIPENSIVVGHSFGGAIINAMIAECAQKFESIIYLSALVPPAGEKPFERMSKADQKEYAKAVDFKHGKIIPKTPKYFFSITDVAYKFDLSNHPKLYEESMNLSQGPVIYNPAILAKIPKAYIFTNRDQVLSQKTQEAFVLRAGILKTTTVPTGHFSMLSNPELLTNEILNLIRK